MGGIEGDLPRSWRYESLGGVVGAVEGGCGSGLNDCLAMLYMLPALVWGLVSGLFGEVGR